MTYTDYLNELARRLDKTPEALEEQYGDMILDLYEDGQTIDGAITDLEADDEEYAGTHRRPF